MKLRPYQRQAVAATLAHFRQSGEPACIVLPTGAGKSLIIAELARLAKGRVLVLAHVKELCAQNHAKYQALASAPGFRRAGLYSAGLGQKRAQQAVTFASVQSVARHLTDFSQEISLLIIDECHRVSGSDESQYGLILQALKRDNPDLKVLGLTATPYRLGSGWSYRFHYTGITRSEEVRPFEVCVFEVPLRQMIADGYLTPPLLEDTPIAQYDFLSMQAGLEPEPVESAVNTLLVTQRRVTEAITRQIVQLSREQGRKGVMIFAASVDHAREIAGLLPPNETALILGETANQERDAQIQRFCQGQARYLVNVAVLTTGFDAAHVDFIAILRPTESVGLYQQIVGRGLRRAPGKRDCLVMDYAGNGFNLFSPEVGEVKPKSGSVPVAVACPVCDFENHFWGTTDDAGRVLEHFGRRCQRFSLDPGGRRQRCEYRFRFKECPKCNAENDIAARSCQACQAVLVDADDQLKRALKLSDALVLRVAGMTLAREGSRLKVTYHDEDGTRVSERFDFAHLGQRAVFNRIFSRRLASGRRPLELTEAEQALSLQAHFPHPDFVVARKQKGSRASSHYYRVQARIFDYQGPRRKALAT